MQITRQTEYGVRILLELAQAPEGQLVSSHIISTRQDVPEMFLQKTLQLLSRAGLVITQRGVQGGVRLAKPAESITIADVLVAIEGPLAINVCLNAGYNCHNMEVCKVRSILVRAQEALAVELSKESLADIIAMSEEG
ncbi:MAG: Rrf2 family transcriptional regulator [Syntrophomonadaceae bacterium]|nr:Rrf2 family transcriptional regulator [Syntrophomonadaceae bacterium]